ncbi:YeeE/YedE family protein [Aquabacterium fontiphilum]|jgi:uncharacterized membrane protein YedE/YeeE|uniref:YeeE/YedE family protein n=1 Tax=Aquabacterium fontiphilum TaxID=450365 RepID=UPI0013786367|nr:YeeE/YedE family protein [Aquabacterium fontiphilum]NBD19926.1 YeeE/YedE family protein [Aquabacterium fontiphilum]
MNIVNFTPEAAALGGALIGLAAVVLMAGLGRIAGISNITYTLVDDWRAGRVGGWRLAFVAGMVLGAAGYYLATGASAVPPRELHPVWLVVAGLLVGYGTALGSGCTSGHGVCGLSRLSVRSLAAVCTFMATAALTVFVVRHVLG